MDVAVVGAGPYGLSVAAHLAAQGTNFTVFGRPLETWRDHMPRGMLLKSDGFASSLSAPTAGASLGEYCAGRGLAYHPLAIPVPLQTFVDYGLDFQRRFVPDLDPRTVTGLDRTEGGYRLTLDDGETLAARRVVMAVGITHFAHMPAVLAGLPTDLVTHSCAHADVSRFRGREVVVIGAGASAVDLAVHLAEAGADVRLVARRDQVRFGSEPGEGPRSRWSRLRHPSSGLGPGLRSRLYSDAPDLVRLLPPTLRQEIVRRHLGPASPWRLRRRFETQVNLIAGCEVAHAERQGNRVRLRLIAGDGEETDLDADHVIAATGYRPDLRRLNFMAQPLRQRLRTAANTPVLNQSFETSERGLYFVGSAAANSFGPLMRFMYGVDFTARRVSRHLVRAAR